MDEYSHFSARASLTAVGEWMQRQGIWEAVTRRVQIRQKTLRHRPLDKVLDAFIAMLAGGGGVVEINTRVRPERVLQAAFGRGDCAEQSTVSETLNACTADTVLQMRSALDEVYRVHSQGYRHD